MKRKTAFYSRRGAQRLSVKDLSSSKIKLRRYMMQHKAIRSPWYNAVNT